MTYEVELEALHHSDQRAVRTVDSLTDTDWSGPSLLPGWSRTHVVAHLALNAEGFARAIEGELEGARTPIYDSDDARDADIESLSAAAPGEVRERLFAATQRLRDDFAHLTADQWAGTVIRTPDGPEWLVSRLVTARQLEVEVHHADLNAGYAATDWPIEFAVRLLDDLTANHADSGAGEPFAARATDLGRTWQVGTGPEVVSGTAGELAWWLLGRGEGQGLTSDRDPGTTALPALGPWQRQLRR